MKKSKQASSAVTLQKEITAAAAIDTASPQVDTTASQQPEDAPEKPTAPATEPEASHAKTDDDLQSSAVITTAALGDSSAGGTPPPALASFRVLSPIKRGGRIYPVGAPIELTDEQARDVGSKFIEFADLKSQP